MLQEAMVPLPDGNVLLTYLDVTDTARVERALRERNEALETAGRLKSEFIANVSYELRTPLNAVIGFAEILNNQYFGDLNPRQLDYSRGILASSQQLMKLINDILDLATIEAGYMVLETGRVEVSVAGQEPDRAPRRDVAIDSVPGQGTRIICRLPVPQRDTADAGACSPQSAPPAGTAPGGRSTNSHAERGKQREAETQLAA